MQKFHHFQANSTAHDLNDGAYGMSRPEVLDVVQADELTRVFCTGGSDVRFRAEDGVLTAEKVRGESGTQRGYHIDLSRCDTVEIVGRPDVQANPAATGLFKDLNTLLAIEYDPNPVHIADWVRYNVDNAGAEAALVVRRLALDETSFDFSELKKLLRSVNGLKRVVLLDYTVPLGKPDKPDERHRMLAPDAPGKALLDPPMNDAWRSPLGQHVVYAAARYRFLSQARAVLHCSIADMVGSTGGGKTIFDNAVASPTYTKLTARYAYPWKLAKDGATRASDHCCVRFDNNNGASIWCADPRKGGFWRPFHAMTQPPQALTDRVDVWRCMALRHKQLKLSEMAPKSSLVLEPRLVKAMKKTLKAKPVLPEERSKPEHSHDNDKVLVVTTMKDEGPFILEWLAYHRSIGVTDFLVYTNDCSDGTDRMFNLLQAKGYLEHRKNPYREVGLRPQHAAYHDASESRIAGDADWVMCMDVDEYINIHVGDGTLPALFDAVGDANMISMTWRLFGNAGVVDFKDKFITEQFTRCAPKFIRKPHQAWGFKTIFRTNEYYKKYGVHRPKGLKPEMLDHVKWVNGSGNPMPPKMLRNGWRSSAGNWGYGLVTLNHYSLRSADSFLVKRFRGRVNHVDRDQGLNYWFRMNNNATEDHSILAKLPAAKAEYEKFMADDEIREMHESCLAAHTARVSILKESPDYKALFDEITGERLNVLSQMSHHFGAQVFADGSDVIPEDFHMTHKTYEEDQPVSPPDPSPPAKPYFS